MAEPMSDARLAEICAIGYADDHEVIGELLAEVERLRQEDPVVAVMREYTATLKRGAFWLAVYVIAGIAVWDLCNHMLRLPDPVSVLACFLAGVPVGGLHAWRRPDGYKVYGDEEWIRGSVKRYGGSYMAAETCSYQGEWRAVAGDA